MFEYAKVRGDLSEPYARDQLALWIERYAEHVANERAEQIAQAIEANRRPEGGGDTDVRGARTARLRAARIAREV